MSMKVKLVSDGVEQILEAKQGELLPAVFHRHGVSLDMPCGGRGTCGSCSVSIDGEACLACQTRVEQDMRIEQNCDAGMQILVADATLDVPPVDPMFAAYGVSVDIGTTTVCAALFDRAGQMDAFTQKNPQVSFGGDVISRIEHALSGEGEALAGQIRGAIAMMIQELCAMWGIDSGLIDALVISGNTAMLYLLTGQDPKCLSRAPFLADRLFGAFVDATAFDLPVLSDAQVYLPRCISAFVGADITCAVLASGMCVLGKTALLVDIGTNGEIALWHDGTLTCCSTAAGPALEGAGIAHGTYGVYGAIDHVWLEDGQVRCSTIGGGSAVGICGSGIVDAIAVMLELEIIDETGAFADDSDEFPLRDGVCMTGADVRKVQLAKGAIRAGIETLLETAGVKHAEVETLYIAGGFGSLMRLDSAAAIGLIPAEMVDRAEVIGNAAHTGASMLLRDKAMVDTAAHLAQETETLALDANPVFSNHYMEYMLF